MCWRGGGELWENDRVIRVPNFFLDLKSVILTYE